MRIRKTINELLKQNANLAAEVAELKKQLAEINGRLPEYEEAIAKGVGDQWNRAVQSVIDYNPFGKSKVGGI